MNYDEHDHDHDMIIDNYRKVRCVSKEIRLRRRKHDLIIPYSIGKKKMTKKIAVFCYIRRFVILLHIHILKK
jgi:hypothetical protein